MSSAITAAVILCVAEVVEETTVGGIVLLEKTRQAEKSLSVYVTVVEIGHDAWSDKSTDYCEVGDKVLVGQLGTQRFEHV